MASGKTEDVKKMENDHMQAKRVIVFLLTLSGCVLVVLDESSEAKVSDFTHQVITHQDVGSPEVPVHIVHSFHVRHSRGNLRTTHILSRCRAQCRPPEYPQNINRFIYIMKTMTVALAHTKSATTIVFRSLNMVCPSLQGYIVFHFKF